ncbi:MAG: flagellar assembly peptidoglycan hydrolase FlgJ [Gammaproteobacteria bacterium]|nr:MAG: flagellar assembly peptidoglycan hydrolase FlgJ [Gammaproteobacteria bacterium]HDN69190.1 flagellar assembly peptidoglycan hydrolase FlgJ [Gammaproteobacteria bacterium]
MISESSMADVYTDFQGLMRLKTEAGKQTPEAIQETARQFEALFVQTMLKAMRDASPGEGMGESDQTEFYRDMHDQQMALHMVKGRGLGIADMLVSSMGGRQPDAEAVSESAAAVPGMAAVSRPVISTGSVQPLMTESVTGPMVQLNSAVPVQALVNMSAEAGKQILDRDISEANWRPDTPEEFIRDLLPHARKGAAELGVKPGVLIAQAALETGWGQKVISHADGRSSFNLFGIKADAGWSGDKVSVATLEYENGIAEKQRAVFRSYDSLEGAVSGYVDFLRSNPRYQHALEQAADPKAYLSGLKAAGYATDPAYAEKITAIMQQDSFMKDMDKLTLSQVSQL